MHACLNGQYSGATKVVIAAATTTDDTKEQERWREKEGERRPFSLSALSSFSFWCSTCFLGSRGFLIPRVSSHQTSLLLPLANAFGSFISPCPWLINVLLIKMSVLTSSDTSYKVESHHHGGSPDLLPTSLLAEWKFTLVPLGRLTLPATP